MLLDLEPERRPIGKRHARREHAAARIAEAVLQEDAQRAREAIALGVAVADLHDGHAFAQAGLEFGKRLMEGSERCGGVGAGNGNGNRDRAGRARGFGIRRRHIRGNR